MESAVHVHAAVVCVGSGPIRKFFSGEDELRTGCPFRSSACSRQDLQDERSFRRHHRRRVFHPMLPYIWTLPFCWCFLPR